jgi:HK97 family phage portal protein
VGLRSWLGYGPTAPQILPVTVSGPSVELIPEGVSLDEYLKSILAQPVEKLWREQPHLRTVVGFVSRNIAHLGLQVFERDEDDGRNRLRKTPLAQLLDDPNPEMTQFELIEATVASRMLYDETYWYVARDTAAPSGWVIRHIPTSWVIGKVGATAFTVAGYKIALPGTNGQAIEIPVEDMVVFRGWNPVDPKAGVSPVMALKAILAEQVHAQVFRDQMWKRGGRVGQWIYRPAPPASPQWSKEARENWIKQYRENFAGDKAPRAGGEPLLEDGMELRSNRFSAKDEQYIDAMKLSLQTCAQVYFVNPTMVGVLDNANYSNVREFRRALYGDNLGPEIERIQQRINKSVVPKLADRERVYCEFNLQTKLAGAFEEQSDLLQRAVGGPYMTRNEGRAKLNMSRIDGGDELIVPLNVTPNGDQEPTPAGPAQKPDEDPSEETKNGRNHRINGHPINV